MTLRFRFQLYANICFVVLCLYTIHKIADNHARPTFAICNTAVAEIDFQHSLSFIPVASHYT
jgi:hypothetical protein